MGEEQQQRRGGRGGGRGRGPRDDAASLGREDFNQGPPTGEEGEDGADWQQFLNNYFDEKE